MGNALMDQVCGVCGRTSRHIAVTPAPRGDARRCLCQKGGCMMCTEGSKGWMAGLHGVCLRRSPCAVSAIGGAAPELSFLRYRIFLYPIS